MWKVLTIISIGTCRPLRHLYSFPDWVKILCDVGTYLVTRRATLVFC